MNKIKRNLHQVKDPENLDLILEKQKFLKKLGWKGKEQSFIKHVFCFWYHEDYPGIGYPLDVAHSIEMREKRKEERQKSIENQTAIIKCNKCGDDLKRDCGYYGLKYAEVWGGYDSDPLSDCIIYRFSLCEKCLKVLFDSFKTPVETECYL